MEKGLEKEFKFYVANQRKLVRKHRNKYVVIRNEQVIGVFDDELDAIRETTKKHELGTFLVQKCEPGKDSYTQTYHSRVAVG